MAAILSVGWYWDGSSSGIQPRYITSHPGQLSLLPSVGQEMNTGQRCAAAGDKRQDNVSFRWWISVWMAGKTVRTCHSERLEVTILTKNVVS